MKIRCTLLSFFVVMGSLMAQELPNTLTREQKLFGLSMLWSEAKYNEAFFSNIGEARWDSAYQAFMKPVMETPNDYEYVRELTRFCALLRDGHSRVFANLPLPIITTYFDKFQWYLSNIEGKAIVTSINDKQKEWIPVGSEIVEVNGMPTAGYLNKNVIPYICASADYVRLDMAISGMFRSLKGDSYQVKIITPAGKVLDMKITHELRKEIMDDVMYPQKSPWKLVELRWYPGQIAYVALNSFNDTKAVDEFVSIFPELKNAEKLIIDLRSNGGGNTNTGAAILSYLIPDSVLIGSMWQTRIHNPAYMSWGRNFMPQDTTGNSFMKKAYLVAQRQCYEVGGNHSQEISASQERLVVPTVLLIGHNTASAAEDFLVLADKQKHMVKIGQNSNGSTGNPINFRITDNIGFMICSKKDTYPDGRDFVGCGVKPDIEVIPTVKDFIKKYDRTLEKALDFLKKAK